MGLAKDAGLAHGRSLLPDRLGIAAFQAAVLYVLVDSTGEPRSWPASEPALFAPMLLAAFFLPIIAMLGRSSLPPRPLAAWVAGAGLVVAGLGYHSVARGVTPDLPFGTSHVPGFRLSAALAAGLFVGHTLVIDAVAERRLRTPYPRHFDTAWKLGVQVGLALAELGAHVANVADHVDHDVEMIFARAEDGCGARLLVGTEREGRVLRRQPCERDGKLLRSGFRLWRD